MFITAIMRIGAIQGVAGTPDDLDPLNEVDVHDQLITDEHRIEHGIILPDAVDHEQHPGSVIAGQTEAPDTGIQVIAVIGHGKTRDALQDVRQVPVAEFFDLSAVTMVTEAGASLTGCS